MRESEEYTIGLHQLCEYVLNKLKKKKKELPMVEIGVFKGESSYIFSDYFRRVYCVDPYWPGYDCSDYASEEKVLRDAEKEFDNLRKNKTNLFPVREFSKKASEYFSDQELFFVYIDACHTYDAVKGDISLWINKISKDGFIAGHDYNLPGVRKAVNEVFGKPEKIFIDNSWIISKRTILKKEEKNNGT